MRCQKCGFENPRGFRFCGQCGTPLVAETPPAPAPAADEPARVEGASAERRWLSTMFCDLAGSTELSARLDPEELREVVRAYQSTCARIIERFDGTIAQYLGDGILVYFGYPKAHGDDAQRAVLAALEIIDAIPKLTTPSGEPLAVRIGIDTGLAVVGEVGAGQRREQLALGQTPNVAARLQAFAELNTVLISQPTRFLLGDEVFCRSMGERTLRGVNEPVHIYQVLPAGGTDTPPARVTRRPTPPVGREEELDELLGIWRDVRNGEGRVLLIEGEPGIGKTRLLQLFFHAISKTSHRVLRAQCSAYDRESAFAPLVEILRHVVGQGKSSLDIDRLELEMARQALPLDETVPVLATLLALDPPTHRPPPPKEPDERRAATNLALIRWLLARATRRPLVLVIEDVHEIDASTVELLYELGRKIAETPILVILTGRPGGAFEAFSELPARRLRLGRLDDEAAAAMILSIPDGDRLPPAWVRELVARSDGVPLYIEELTRAVLEIEGASAGTGNIPVRLHELLLSRLDGFGGDKALVQWAATLGRRFDRELLASVTHIGKDAIDQAVERLIDAGLWVEADGALVFRQGLLQEVAYRSLLKRQRRRYHERIAEVVVHSFADLATARPELVAHHFTEAERFPDAVHYWTRAGQRAAMHGSLEARGHFIRGLELLENQPPSEARDAARRALEAALAEIDTAPSMRIYPTTT
ncbi:MAG: AAA family ATPase [Acidobacteriota bacterium]